MSPIPLFVFAILIGLFVIQAKSVFGSEAPITRGRVALLLVLGALMLLGPVAILTALATFEERRHARIYHNTFVTMLEVHGNGDTETLDKALDAYQAAIDSKKSMLDATLLANRELSQSPTFPIDRRPRFFTLP